MDDGREGTALIERDLARGAMIAHADELTALDQAIGDGDHGLNMKRGFEAVLADLDALAAKPLPDALKAVGMTLVMKVGGASGPLYGTLFMALGKELPAEPDARRSSPRALAAAIDGGQGARQVGRRPEDDARRAGAGAASARAAGDATLGRRAQRARGRRGDHPDEGDPRSRLLPRRALDRPHGSRARVERADRSRRSATRSERA